MVLERGKNDLISRYAAYNDNCPEDALRMVLARGKDDEVSYYAAQNPKCPPDARINWLIDIGKIEQAKQEIDETYLEDFIKQYNKTKTKTERG